MQSREISPPRPAIVAIFVFAVAPLIHAIPSVLQAPRARVFRAITWRVQVRDSAPSPRRLIDGQGKIRVRGASSQILFASRVLHLLGLV